MTRPNDYTAASEARKEQRVMTLREFEAWLKDANPFAGATTTRDRIVVKAFGEGGGR